jgi:tight adherence protein B
MSEILIGGGVAALGVGAIAWALRSRRQRGAAIERLHESQVEAAPQELPPPPAVLRRYRWVAPVMGLLAGGGAFLAIEEVRALPLSLALGLVVAVIASLLELNLHAGRSLRFEMQLVDVIDLVVSSLGAGSATMDALENAARESEKPLRPLMNDLVGRVRLGDSPRDVLEEFARLVPLESFRLFCFTLAVHEEVGGSLAPTLSKVGRTIRDRIEIQRRIRAEATQAQASVVGILLITYGLGFVTWRTHPERVEDFLGSDVGTKLAAGAVMLQAIGLVWMSRLTQIRF